MNNIEKAKELLKDDLTCVLVKDDIVYTSKARGIAPVLNYLNEKVDLNSFSVADRIVGKAAAFLFVNAGIKEVYTEVLSVKGKEILEKYNIPYEYKTLVDKIINRTGDDICPMEKTVQDVDDPKIAYELLDAKIKSLRK
ncbi:MAG: DUF1893 domain-containing protein [Erysipelotrichaceae bacterium]|nr:DUF1893 domain-containing protein [Erysipelotrichaceae bacterium]